MNKNINIEFGKIPPQAVELEEVVLGALLLEKNAIFLIQNILKPESFYKEQHQKIYNAILELSKNNKPVDPLTVSDELEKRNELEECEGKYYIHHLTSNVASAGNIEYHSQIIAQKYIQRELIRIANEVNNKAFDNGIDVADLISYLDKEREGLEIAETSKDIKQLSNAVLKRVIGIMDGSVNKYGVKSGLAIDKITYGFQNSDNIIIAGRPGMGKTSFLITLIKQFIKNNISVSVFSLEMTALQLIKRLAVNMTGIYNDQLKNGRLDKNEMEQLENMIEIIGNSKLYIDDTAKINIDQLRLKAIEMKRKYDIKILLIDYLQLMGGIEYKNRITNRVGEVSEISRGIKALAKELNIPIIAFAQLNRKIEDSKRLPILSDLKNSGSIEEDADIVMFLHRYELSGVEQYKDGTSTEGMINLVIAKHRDGELTNLRMYFEKATMTIKNNKEIEKLPF